MSFLAPLAFGLAAIVIPALLILYFLKLRRRQEFVSSTLLWRRAVQDLQVNAPFQKLRKNLLLFLQLLILAAGITALARPVVDVGVTGEASIVILIDRSASMNAIDGEGDRTRLDIVKEQAARLVKTLNRSANRFWSIFSPREKTRVMVVAFADRASVVAPFTTNTAEIVSQIDNLQPTDGTTNLREALELAEAYMMQTRLEQTTDPSEQASEIILYSDGAVGDVSDVVLRAARLRYYPIGETRDNVGITALRIQRNYERPELLGTFLQVQNFGPEPITTDVSLYVDERLSTVQTITLAGARQPDAMPAGSLNDDDDVPPAESDADEPQPSIPPPSDADLERGSSGALSFEFVLPKGAVLEARLARKDGLPVDDHAFVVAPPPRLMNVLLVSAGNFFLETALRNLPLETFDYLTPEQYESAGDDRFWRDDGTARYDVAIFDKHETGKLPVGNNIFFACIPDVEDLSVTGETEALTLQWWDDTHPILRHVVLDYVFAAKSLIVTTPKDIEKLVEGSQGPVIFRYAREGRHFLIVTFPIEASTWWGKTSFPVFIYNALRYMGSGGAIAEREPHRPGDALRIPLPPEVKEAKLLRPDGERVTVRADDRNVARYAGTHWVGVYTVEPGVPGQERIAVNLESAPESDIVPRSTIKVGGETQVEIGKQINTATPEVWRWFIGLALLLAIIEWYIYNRRVMI